ncbi:MAG TPA: GTPase Era [Verrucomicrobiota bacterium]|nr:GTPase Era [Verrucomicrobiota bacterium]
MSESLSPHFRAGLAALIGRTNVGKSTLVNALVGHKVSIVTPKPQTTRHVVHGVVNGPACQLVLVDTPGFFHTKSSKLVTELHRKARAALEGIDVVVHVVDPTREIGAEDEMVVEVLRGVSQPRVLCLNKSDVRAQPARDAWRARGSECAALVEISALKGAGLESLKAALFRLLPEHPPFYSPGEITNSNRDFQVAELIREQVYQLTGQEVPYRTVIELDAITESVTRDGQPFLEIKAAVLTPNDRYQRMLIGTGARMIRQIGTAARLELEKKLGQKVFLDLDVLVDRHVGE